MLKIAYIHPSVIGGGVTQPVYEVLGPPTVCTFVNDVFNLVFLIAIDHNRRRSVVVGSIGGEGRRVNIRFQVRNMKSRMNRQVCRKIKSISNLTNTIKNPERANEFLSQFPRGAASLIVSCYIFCIQEDQVVNLKIKFSSMFVGVVLLLILRVAY